MSLPLALAAALLAVRPAAAGHAVEAVLDAGHPGAAISQLVFGVSFAGSVYRDEALIALDRWGGNRFTLFDWKTGNDNAGSDWFFSNGGQNAKRPGDVWIHEALRRNRAAGITTLVTVPMTGWVAKDNSSAAYSVAKYGPQKGTDRWRPDHGDGTRPDGKPVEGNDPADAFKPAPPAYAGEFVRFLRETHGPAAEARICFALDNEPGLWNSTHRSVHPKPVTYDELWERTVAWATAIKDADPTALVFGPVEWGWLGIVGSSADGKDRADSKAHGADYLLKWYIGKLAEHRRKTGRLLVDVIDVHDYPEIYVEGEGRIALSDERGKGPKSERARILATRTWWDPGYRPAGEGGSSWIWEPVNLLPRIQGWIREECPGLGLAVTEWNFGGNGTVNGALVHALLFRSLMREGAYAAAEWGPPVPRDPAFRAYRLFRNYDGKGGRFEGAYVEGSSDDDLVTVFGALDAPSGRLRAAVVNADPGQGRRVRLVPGIPLAGVRARVFTLADGGEIAESAVESSAGRVVLEVPAYSVTAVELAVAPAR